VTRVTEWHFLSPSRVDSGVLPLIQKSVPLAIFLSGRHYGPVLSMQDIIQQLGALFLSATPTALLFIVLVISYQFLVQKPLTATLARRRALTEGAMEDARKAIAQAEAKTAEYADRLRQARGEAFKVREQRIRQWNAERDVALDSARRSAGDKVRQAKASLDSEVESARSAIRASASDLAGQAVRAVLPMAAGGSR
jgi:F-type H+-transporting ATPase subunit b